jgi:uncharacterized protein YegJ (DUF2314 family)
MKFLTLLLFAAMFTSCSNNQSNKNQTTDKPALDTIANTYTVTSDDASMNMAIDEAKKTIGQFDLALKSNNPSFIDFAVKKRYKTTDDGGEHMWIAVTGILNGNYTGTVNNDAEQTNEVKYGDTVMVRKDEITDWMYLDNNILRGGYTIREVRKHMNKEERIKMDKELRYRIED